jgi:hypothetical protein
VTDEVHPRVISSLRVVCTIMEAAYCHERNPSPNGRPLELTGVNSKPRRVPEDNVGEGSTEYSAKFVAPHSSSEDTRLELEWRLSISLAAQTEQDQRIAQLTDELTLKSALLEQAEVSAVETVRRAGSGLREHANDRRVMRISLVKQRNVELVDTRTRLRDMQTKLEANGSELEAARSLLTDMEKGLIKNKAGADIMRPDCYCGATGSMRNDYYQVVEVTLGFFCSTL